MTGVSAAEVSERVRAVTDPEIPTVTIGDLGIVRDVRWMSMPVPSR